MKQSQINTDDRMTCIRKWDHQWEDELFQCVLNACYEVGMLVSQLKRSRSRVFFHIFYFNFIFCGFDGENTSTSVPSGLEHQQNIKVSL